MSEHVSDHYGADFWRGVCADLMRSRGVRRFERVTSTPDEMVAATRGAIRPAGGYVVVMDEGAGAQSDTTQPAPSRLDDAKRLDYIREYSRGRSPGDIARSMGLNDEDAEAHRLDAAAAGALLDYHDVWGAPGAIAVLRLVDRVAEMTAERDRMREDLDAARRASGYAERLWRGAEAQSDAAMDALRRVGGFADRALSPRAGLDDVRSFLRSITGTARAALAQQPAAERAEARPIPTIEEMAGSRPNMTGGLSSEEYVRRLRGDFPEVQEAKEAVIAAARHRARSHIAGSHMPLKPCTCPLCLSVAKLDVVEAEK